MATRIRTTRVGKGPRRLVLAALAACALGALACAALSLVPYDALKGFADQRAKGGQAGLFGPEYYAGLVMRLRVGAALLAGGCVLGGYLLERLAAGVVELRASGRELLADARRGVSRFAHEDPGLHRLGVLLAIAVGVLLRLHFLLADPPLKYNEAYTTAQYLVRPWYVVLAYYDVPNNHVLHTFLARLSVGLFGEGSPAIRLPAFLAGVLSVPAAYLSARLLYDRGVALVAASAVAISSPLVDYSVNARGYSLLVFFFLATLALAGYVSRRRSIAAWFAIALVGALGVHTVPVMVFPLGGLYLWLLGNRLLGQDVRYGYGTLLAAGSLSVALALVFYAPILMAMGPGALLANDYVISRTWSDFSGRLPRTLDDLRYLLPHFAGRGSYWGEALLALGVVLTLVLHRRVATFRLPLIVPFALWVTAVMLVKRVTPAPHMLLFAAPLLVLVSVPGLVHVFAQRFVTVPLLALASAIVLGVGSASKVQAGLGPGHFPEARELVAERFLHLGEDEEVVGSDPFDAVLACYFRRAGIDLSALNSVDAGDRTLWVFVHRNRQRTVDRVYELCLMPAPRERSRELVLQGAEFDLYRVEIGAPPVQGRDARGGEHERIPE